MAKGAGQAERAVRAELISFQLAKPEIHHIHAAKDEQCREQLYRGELLACKQHGYERGKHRLQVNIRARGGGAQEAQCVNVPEIGKEGDTDDNERKG